MYKYGKEMLWFYDDQVLFNIFEFMCYLNEKY